MRLRANAAAASERRAICATPTKKEARHQPPTPTNQPTMETPNKPVVAYFYDEEIGNFCLGPGNPMRPHRARLTNALLGGYDVFPELKVYRPRKRTEEELAQFHADGECARLGRRTKNGPLPPLLRSCDAPLGLHTITTDRNSVF